MICLPRHAFPCCFLLALIQKTESIFGTDCIDRLQTLTSAKFKDEYQFQKPVILTAASRNSGARATWTPQRFIDVHGHLDVTVGNYLELAFRGDGTQKMKLQDYVDSGMPGYLFDRSFFMQKGTSSLRRQLEFADFLSYNVDPILAFGGKSSGITFHIHHDSTLELLSGRKTWAVYPPNTKITPSFDKLKQLLENTTNLPDDVCVFKQEPGEIVYIPEGWYHATSNDENMTFAIGHQRCMFVQNCPTEPTSFLFAHEVGKLVSMRPLPGQELGVALDVLGKATQKWPNEPNLLTFLAEAYHQMGGEQNLKKARKHIKKSLELDPDNVHTVLVWSQLCALLVTATGPLGKREACMKHVDRIEDKMRHDAKLLNNPMDHLDNLKKSLGLSIYRTAKRAPEPVHPEL